jgi:asparagine synthase (glutamine-hydrolysing)
MKAIFGVLCRDAVCHPQPLLKNMQAGFPGEIGYLFQSWEGDGIGLCQTIIRPSFHSTGSIQIQTESSADFKFIVAGRLDNVSELCRNLNINDSERSALTEQEVMRRAYEMWGRECSARMYGDWVFAAWQPAERQLVLARSHYGTIPLYYVDQAIFAFATSRRALLSLDQISTELDELWLAQYLLSWPAYLGERTPHKPIKCLPPAHYLVVTEKGCHIHCYWHPEVAAEMHLSSREEYVEGFRAVFNEAVGCRLRSDGPIAATLSGGLDSSSVAVTAARLLAERGQRLTAFTSVPSFDTKRYETERFGDELPFARATADYAGNIDLHPRDSTGLSPVLAVRQALNRECVPCHGAGNLYWLMDMQQSAPAAGCSVLLTGAAGNAGISWTGDLSSQSWSFLHSHFEWLTILKRIIGMTKQKLKYALPTEILAGVHQKRLEQLQWHRRSAINPDFAKRIRVLEQFLHDPREQPPRNPREQRARILMLGRSATGTYTAEIGAWHGVEMRDPTADARVLEYVLAVPDHIFMDPQTGIDRWLIREAMKGRLPDEVRLNRNRGRQAADMVPRLRACAADVEEALEELRRGPAAEFVDVDHMRRVWSMIRTKDTPEANDMSKKIILRGIMAGLFVNGFYEQN